MSKFSSELVDLLAEKVLIGLSSEENELVLNDFDFIEANMDLINEIDGIEQIVPMIHPFDLYECTLSEDEDEETENIEEILRNCDKIEGREVEVPKVVG